MSKDNKEDLCIMAYEMGYECFEYSYTEWANMLQNSDNPQELWSNGNENTMPISDMATQGTGKNSQSQMIWKVEDILGFDRENQDWDNAGIYGIIEDCCVSWEAGAYDALIGRDYNPKRLPFVE